MIRARGGFHVLLTSKDSWFFAAQELPAGIFVVRRILAKGMSWPTKGRFSAERRPLRADVADSKLPAAIAGLRA